MARIDPSIHLMPAAAKKQQLIEREAEQRQKQQQKRQKRLIALQSFLARDIPNATEIPCRLSPLDYAILLRGEDNLSVLSAWLREAGYSLVITYTVDSGSLCDVDDLEVRYYDDRGYADAGAILWMNRQMGTRTCQ